MERSDLEQRLLTLLTRVAPDVDPASVDPARPLREQFDFDSMDMLHFAASVSEAFGVPIAEREYSALTSLKGAADLVTRKLAMPQ